MLRNVCFENFVKYKDYQFLEFHDDGPSIFVGENGSGKSAVLEGIRRCLKPELSTSVSSIPDLSHMSYFICNYEETDSENNGVICGVVAIPEESVHDKKEIVEYDNIEEDSEVNFMTLFREKETEDKIRCTEATQDDSVGIISGSPTDDSPKNDTIISCWRSVDNSTRAQYYSVLHDAKTSEDRSNGKKTTDNQTEILPVEVKTTSDGGSSRNKSETTVDGDSSESISEGKTGNVPGNAKTTLDGKSSEYISEGQTCESIPEGQSGSVLLNANIASDENAKTTSDRSSSESMCEGSAVSGNENPNKKITVYKFAMQYSKNMEEIQPLQIYRLQAETGEYHKLRDINDIEEDNFLQLEKNFKEAMTSVKDRVSEKKKQEIINKVTIFLKTVFCRKNINKERFDENRQDLLKVLSNQVVFTFPLRSIGPLQWSESNRIRQDRRQDNYLEAEKRCEIIKCYLEDKEKQNNRFDSKIEENIFKAITQMNDYRFKLINGRIHLPEGKYALLKTPEGILEAKAFSIFMSSIDFKTIILEEPDRGMHPQFIARMVEVIKQYKKEKRVILTTHNTAFVTPWSIPGCFVFKRQGDECSVLSGRKIVGAPTPDNIRLKQLRLLSSDHMSDILFATKVLFYEGASEMLFLTELKEQILQGELEDITLFRDEQERYEMLKNTVAGLCLVPMNGVKNAANCHRFCEELGIKHLIIVDKDSVIEREKAYIEMSKKERKEETKKEKPNLLDKRQRSMTKARIFFWLDGDIEDMLIDICDHSDKLLEQLEQQKVTLNPEKYGLKKDPAEKLFLRDAVNLVNVRSSVKLIAEHCQENDDLYNLIKCLEHSDMQLA